MRISLVVFRPEPSTLDDSYLCEYEVLVDGEPVRCCQVSGIDAMNALLEAIRLLAIDTRNRFSWSGLIPEDFLLDMEGV
jgi:hypothetical protein